MAKFLPVKRSDLSVSLVLDSERDRTVRGLLSKVRGHRGLVLASFASWRELRETVPSEGSVLVCGGHIALGNEDLSYLRSVTHNQNPIGLIAYVRPNNAEFRFVHSLGVARINCEVVVYGVDDVSLIELVLIDKAASPELAAVNGLGRGIGLPDDVRGAFEKALIDPGKWSVKLLATYCGVSRRTLERLFVKAGLRTPGRYITDARRTLATSLLADHTASRVEVMRACGWRDPRSLGRALDETDKPHRSQKRESAP